LARRGQLLIARIGQNSAYSFCWQEEVETTKLRTEWENRCKISDEYRK
jgi:hypothetical protein